MTGNEERLHFDLAFEQDRAGKAFLSTQFVRYPFHVCRGLYGNAHDSRTCSVTLQSTSGGLFESDDTHGRIAAGAGARAEVSTAASTIVHSMAHSDAAQSVELDAGAGAVLEYLPQPLILFPGSSLRSNIGVKSHRTATVIFCESFLTHDPKALQGGFDLLDTRVAVSDADGNLLAKDRQRLTGNAWRSGAAGIAGRHQAYASVWMIRQGADADADADLLQRVRQALQSPSTYSGASLLPNDAGISIRLLCPDAIELQRTLGRVLVELRQTGRVAQVQAQLETQPESIASA